MSSTDKLTDEQFLTLIDKVAQQHITEGKVINLEKPFGINGLQHSFVLSCEYINYDVHTTYDTRLYCDEMCIYFAYHDILIFDELTKKINSTHDAKMKEIVTSVIDLISK